MNAYRFTLHGAELHALPSGALWWPAERMLCVSDLHLGKSLRYARHGGAHLPPYETRDTLARLEADMDGTGARQVICLGDSFDDTMAAHGLDPEERQWILRLQAGRAWTWIEGNHDPGPIDLGGAHQGEVQLGPLTFRHIAAPGAEAEVSGHYHPKAGLRGVSRPAFLLDRSRLIMPAYGTYTGGLRARDKVLAELMGPEALAILTGHRALPIPMPRAAPPRSRAQA
ncbi:ligase-associated DNA damage response endonuclease PdeM [Aquicoccus sp. SCR17]|nr:ligase-associated DNA damage response endonuclease PdeM [Carideicomes alvinocaridis]